MASNTVRAWVAAALLCAACGGGGPEAAQGTTGDGPRFAEATADAGLAGFGGYANSPTGIPWFFGGGVAAGDYDGDGDLDLYVINGHLLRNLLFRNRGDGTFEEVGAAAGVDLSAENRCGPSFVDYDGDGDLDLFVCGITIPPVLLRNRGDGTFEDVTAAAGLVITRTSTLGAAWGDYDRDGDLDCFLTHWVDADESPAAEWLWRNNGDGTFTDVSVDAGIADVYRGPLLDFTFTPNFTDIDNDGWPDLLIAADFSTSRVFRNTGGAFEDVTTAVITDENGMGSAIGDYDNDGDLDWFVTSIFNAAGAQANSKGSSGNRLYRNRGDGTYDDVTDAAGVREGGWGWGACFADLDNDGWLDLVHVNGWTGPFSEPYVVDPSRLFRGGANGAFTETAVAAGFDDTDFGRGIVCFDYDRDGDLDVFVANNSQPPRLFRNDTPGAAWLGVRLVGRPPNTRAAGARVRVTAGGMTCVRELRCGNNYVSQNPVEAHFGLGAATIADEVHVTWPDGAETTLRDVAINRLLVIRDPRLP